MIIGLSGYAQAGKDTVAEIMGRKYGYERVAFADKIREFLYDMNPSTGTELLKAKVDSEGWEQAKRHPEVRRLLQTTGMAGRTLFSEMFWIDQVFSQLDSEKKYVITDVRFTNEANSVKKFGGEIWRIKRQGIEAINSHVSESEMDRYHVDRILSNGGTLEELELLVQTRMDSLLHAN